MKMSCLAGEHSNEQHHETAAEHLLCCAEKWRRGMLRGARIKRARRPNERLQEEDRYSDSGMTVAAAGKSQCRTEQHCNAEKSTSAPEPNDRLRARSHSDHPTEQDDVDWNSGDDQTGQTGFNKFFGERDAAVTAQQQARANNQCRSPLRPGRS